MPVADSQIQNRAQVEQYARELEQFAQQVDELFYRLKRKTDETGQNWSDAKFIEFHQIFNDIIMKQTKGISNTLRNLSVYAKKICEYDRAKDSIKLNI